MSKTKPIAWIFVPIFLALAVASGWASYNYGPLGKPAPVNSACSDLKTFITGEESLGKSQWQQYRTLVTKFQGLGSTSTQRIPLVKQMAITVIDVLGHDLAIYKEMDKNQSCVLSAKRSQLATMITDTETAINFLNGSQPINGAYFNPDLGTWNTNYYSDYVTALDYLKK